MRRIVIEGGSLAGASAAITASSWGASVTIVEKSKFPRHKVCGEFLSAEALPVLQRLGVALPEAAPIRRARLCFARREKSFLLPDAAAGISRYLLDQRLLEHAASSGATITAEPLPPQVVAHGRKPAAPRGTRQFGFKAHFEGPSNDSVELYFLTGGYVGVNPVEDGLTNVCGILPESEIRDVAAALHRFPPLRERLTGLTQRMAWMRVGPLVYETKFTSGTDRYLCGDALSFVDPFTGSGMLGAIVSGALAGECAARDIPVPEYLRLAQRRLGRPFVFSSLVRAAIRNGLAETALPFIPGPLLYRLTRPH